MASRADLTRGPPDRQTAWLGAFFVVVYVASAAAWLPILRSGHSPLGLPGPLGLLALVITVMPSLVAILLSGVQGGWPTISER